MEQFEHGFNFDVIFDPLFYPLSFNSCLKNNIFLNYPWYLGLSNFEEKRILFVFRNPVAYRKEFSRLHSSPEFLGSGTQGTPEQE